MKNNELEQIKVSLAALDKEFKEVIANGNGVETEEDKYAKQIYDVANYFYRLIGEVKSYLFRLEQELYTHESDGHIPKIQGAQKMNHVLEVLDLNEDYQAMPKIVYASKNNYVIEAECPKLN